MTIKHLSGDCEVRFVQRRELPAAFHGRYAVTDKNVRRAWPSIAEEPVFEVEPGEQSKSLQAYSGLLDWLSGLGVKREDTLVAFGGGVVGDLAGFVAATYMRGIGLIQVPTTLMALVDSSIGGKVGINLPQGKNLVGTFCPPKEILICTELLSTLPAREFRSGLAEVVKYGCISDPRLIELLGDPVSANDPRLFDLIQSCIQIKAKIVAEDEFERSGRRASLNFGHTIGHAIEKVAGYGALLHGEAVAIGMVAEARLGERTGNTKSGAAKKIAAILKLQGLPVELDPRWNHGELVKAMRGDKKATASGLRFSLITSLGECKLTAGIEEKEVLASLKQS